MSKLPDGFCTRRSDGRGRRQTPGGLPRCQNLPMNARKESLFRKIRRLLVEVLVFLSRPLEDDREAIWSVPNPLRILYFPIFTGISIAIAADIAREVNAAHPGAPWITLTRQAAAEFAPAGIGIAIATLTALQGVATIMAIYQYITNRFTLPVIERHLAQGREEGMAEGEARANQAWREWNRRRMDAASNNLPFDEPPPDSQ